MRGRHHPTLRRPAYTSTTTWRSHAQRMPAPPTARRWKRFTSAGGDHSSPAPPSAAMDILAPPCERRPLGARIGRPVWRRWLWATRWAALAAGADRYGMDGVLYARDYSLAPGFITYPLPAFSASAALPSTVDVLVNNQRQASASVKPGPFDLVNVPVVSGAGQINLVVRDLRGVETVITQSYYASPQLLAAGLSDFSAEAGAMRRNFGTQSNNYGPVFAAGSYRYGFNSALTAGGRVEVQDTRQAGGLEAAGLL